MTQTLNGRPWGQEPCTWPCCTGRPLHPPPGEDGIGGSTHRTIQTVALTTPADQVRRMGVPTLDELRERGQFG